MFTADNVKNGDWFEAPYPACWVAQAQWIEGDKWLLLGEPDSFSSQARMAFETFIDGVHVVIHTKEQLLLRLNNNRWSRYEQKIGSACLSMVTRPAYLCRIKLDAFKGLRCRFRREQEVKRGNETLLGFEYVPIVQVPEKHVTPDVTKEGEKQDAGVIPEKGPVGCD